MAALMSLSSAFGAFLEAKLPGRGASVLAVERLPGGASRETWAVTAEWAEVPGGESRRHELIIRRDPPASLLTAEASDRRHEFLLLERLQGTGARVPRTLWFEDDPRWLERPFFVMERAPGQPTPLPTYPAGGDPTLRDKLADQFVDILASIHRLDWKAMGLDFLGPVGTGEEPARREVARWESIFSAEAAEPHPVIAAAFGWLWANLPSTPVVTLVHADFRSGNYLYDDSGTITAMLDWELAHIGDPMEDLGWACMRFWSGGGLAVGLLPREELLRRYEQRCGIPVDRRRVHFYEVLGTVKMAVIALTGVRAWCVAGALDSQLPLVGLLVPRLAAELLELLGLGRAGAEHAA